MSFSVYLQAFAGGGVGRSSDRSVLDIVEPLITDRREGWATLTTADGGATLYGMDDPGSSLSFSRPAARAVWDVMFEVARSAGFVVMAPGCGTCVVDDAIRAELPDDVPQPVVTVRSGADLVRVVESS